MGNNSEYFTTRESDYLSYPHWAGGYAKDAEVELQEHQTLQDLMMISGRVIKNNNIAYGLVQTLVNALHGGAITIKIRYPGNKDLEEVINKDLELFTSKVDLNYETSLETWLEQATFSTCERGNLLVNLIYDEQKKKDTGSALVIESVDGSRVFTPPHLSNDPLVRNGIKYNEYGKIESFFVKKLFATSNSPADFYELPAFRKIGGVSFRSARMLHCIGPQKPGQGRTVPLLTPILGLLRYINQYLEAVIVGARIAACFVGVMQSESPSGTMKSLENLGTSGEPAFTSFPINPGTIMSSKNGKGGITFASPNKPSDNQDDFLKRLMIFCSSAISFPYILASKDFEKANYSNFRGAVLDANRFLFRWHRQYISFLSWILQFRLKEILTQKKISFSMKKIKMDIRFPQYKSLDPEKTSRSQRLDLANGTSSVSTICAEEQIDYDQLQEELRKETLDKVILEAIRLIEQQKWEEKFGITFPDSATKEESSEENQPEVDNTGTEEEKEARKDDGNW